MTYRIVPNTAVKVTTKNFRSRTWCAVKGWVVYEYLHEILPDLRMLFKIIPREGDLEKNPIELFSGKG